MDPSQPLFNHGVLNVATVLSDGRVLVTGGNSTHIPSTHVEIFDAATDSWREAAPLSIGRNGHAAILLNDGRVLVVGGNDVEVLVAEIYDPVTDSWTSTAPMNAKSVWLAAALLPDGRVLAAGGINPASGEMYTTAEIYDPATGEWSLTAPLVPARCGHAGVVLPDGRALVTGGAQRCGPEVSPFNNVEAYDYQSGTWGALPPLRVPRARHTATLLPDGRIFVAGGVTTSDAYLDSTEILWPAGR
jgi:N-acetylneuraminic acid mutarotase